MRHLRFYILVMMQHLPDWVIYIVFSAVLLCLVLYDLGIFSRAKKEKDKKALFRESIIKTIVWINIGLLFSIFIYYERGEKTSVAYATAFLMEWSLSIDNIFVFIILFESFRISYKHINKVLLIGVILAIIFRIIFITLGIVIVQRFEWVFYFFAAFLLYTGIRIVSASSHKEQKKDMRESKTTKLLSKWLRIKPTERYTFIIKIGRQWYGTTLLLLVALVAITDITFALDSIPAVFALTQDRLAIYTSNIFAVLGLRSLFFTLQGIKDKFVYLPKGIGIVLVFIGVKILIAEFFHYSISPLFSLLFIMICFLSAIGLSMIKTQK